MNVTAHHGDLQARERLARGTERGVIARVAIPPAAVHALRKIESHRAAAASELPSQIPVPQLNALEHRLKLLQNLQNNAINAEHVACLSGAPNLHAHPSPRVLAPAGSRLTASASEQSPAQSAGRGLEAAGASRQNGKPRQGTKLNSR